MVDDSGRVISAGRPSGQSLAAIPQYREIEPSGRPRVVFCDYARRSNSMIKGVHTMFYSSQPEALRAFLRDKLGFSFTDVGEGWLIFDLPEADMGVHPADESEPHPKRGTHDISFYCDDIAGTVAELRATGVEFTSEVQDHGYGLVTYFKMPGELVVQLYQPRYQKKSRRPAESSTK
jgi:catechol 2,3-dioxygenase-like lactoylglutathione lyase family enzyme